MARERSNHMTVSHSLMRSDYLYSRGDGGDHAFGRFLCGGRGMVDQEHALLLHIV